MKFTDQFIKRPVLAVVVNFIIIIAGLQAANSLSVRQYPRSDNVSIIIQTPYIGASAELVKSFITQPLELAIAEADGIDYIESKSTQNFSTINARLKLNYDPIKALTEINSKVSQVRNELPKEAEAPTINILSADNQFAVAYMGFTSDILSQNEITDYLIRAVQPRLAAVKGVQKAEVLGAKVFAMRIWLKPERMAALGITPTQLRDALTKNNVQSAIGQTKGSLVSANLVANTDLHNIDDFKHLIIKESNGRTIRLSDIANIELGTESSDLEVRLSGETAVFMAIYTVPSANTVEVIRQARKELDAIKEGLPKGLNARMANDTTIYIESSIKEVTHTLIETLSIVILVIFLFLGSVRSALIPVIVIPIALIGAIFFIQVFGFTINLLTLLAIVLSVGLVVDDAIVVVENVERHLSKGLSPLDAAIQGARELIKPVIAMTITLAAVYLPIALQGGLTGALFREFALTLAGAVVVSGIVAITLSPMMAAHLLKPNTNAPSFARFTHILFNRLKDSYARFLHQVLANRIIIYLTWLVISAASIPMFMYSAKELAPSEDQGIVFGIMETPSNSTIEQVVPFAKAANDIFQSTPEVDYTFEITEPLFGVAGMLVRPWDERDRSMFEIMPELQSQLAAIPGINFIPIMPPALPGGGGFPVEFILTGMDSTENLLLYAQQLQEKAAKSGLFSFPPIIDIKMDQPQAEIIIDRNRVADLGLTLQQVSQDMSIMLSGNYVNRFNMAGRSYKVIPQVKRDYRLSAEQLNDIYITGPNNQPIPLSSIATIRQGTAPRSLNRLQQMNAVKLSGVSVRTLDEALTFLENEANIILPPSITYDYTGESRQLRTEGNKFIPAFSLALALIFMVLSAQFNSFRDPLIILAGSVPLAMFGALIFTFLKLPNPNIPDWTSSWTTTLNIYSQVGLVTLIGLIAKNGILVVEFANKLQEMGKAKLEAIHEAAVTRLRPILMTTAATVVGHFPLVLVSGPGAEARNSIGLVLVGGMAIGTIFTLFVIPAVYTLLAKDLQKENSADDEILFTIKSTIQPNSKKEKFKKSAEPA